MEANFEKTTISCMDTVLRQVQNNEQTMEMKLQEGMPDIGRVLTGWGQPILRSKEWREDMVQFSGGMMVWVLYEPEDGSTVQCIQGWVPFQMRWDLPENTPDGILRLRCLTRFVDARSTSPRKILVRTGLGAMAEAFVPAELFIVRPKEKSEDIAFLENTYPLRLAKEAGEKTFRLEEELYLPDSAPKIAQLLSWRVNPKITDLRVLGDKTVFRGNANLHVLYRSDAGQIHSWDFEVPFSQYADLQSEYGPDARIDIAMMPTALDLDLQENGNLDLKGGMTAQYQITDKQSVTLAEDAYSTKWELTTQREDLRPPVVLENRRENIYGEQSISGTADLTADVQFLPDFPRQRQTDRGVELEYPGQIQMLYYGEDGRLHGTSSRWEGRQTVAADENSGIIAVPMATEAQAVIGPGGIQVKLELPVDLTTVTDRSIPMITGIERVQQKQLDPDRPTLIFRRAGDKGLWELAKHSNSTMEAIRRANGLSGEPAPGQMLLIPVS